MTNSPEIENAASAKSKGVEVEAIARPIPQINLSANLSWLDARFVSYSTVNTNAPSLAVQNLAARYLPQAPKFKSEVGAAYTWDSSLGDFTLRADAASQNRILFTPFNESL